MSGYSGPAGGGGAASRCWWRRSWSSPWSRRCRGTRPRSSWATGGRRTSSGPSGPTWGWTGRSPAVRRAGWAASWQGDLGYSMLNGIPVSRTIARALPVTLRSGPGPWWSWWSSPCPSGSMPGPIPGPG